ncbi:endodeoxyribonuclease [Paraconiothyrium brasiliense]|uniref:Endodeoxyribonuclease n=1 Tax=Paraconiothyrium brasiliense TaxID=300254 RepID=A0ABR3QYB1_9PLEO
MPDSAQNSRPASSAFETPGTPPSSTATTAPPPVQHGFHVAIADSATPATLPPAVTPATTTRQSVSLGVLSTLWSANGPPTALPPAIVTHAPSPIDAQEAPLQDLAASAGSVPSATTTLTNTLPPTQSAALRALNAPAFQSHASPNLKSKSAKSASSRTTLSSQPVVVRTYSGSRHNSRHSGFHSPRYPNMNGHASQNPSALSAGLAARTERLPSIEDFSFSAILRAVDPEIRDAIDAIAEICARSRLSLADEYDAHLPPQGEITGTGPGWAAGVGALVGRGRISRIGQGWAAADHALTAVPEASSSSERLAGEAQGTASSKKRSQSAYGSLKSVISGGSGKRKASNPAVEQAERVPSQDAKPRGPAWAVHTSSEDHPIITVPSPQVSNHLSLDTSSTIKDIPHVDENRPLPRPQTAIPKPGFSHSRNASLNSLNASRARSSTLSSITSWLPWPRPTDTRVNAHSDLTKAETRLREVLMVAQESAFGRGKAAMSDA